MSVLSGDLQTLSYEAYVYLYSLVTMDVTRQQQTNSPVGSTPGFGPPNQFHHIREFPDVDFRAVVRPNFDTLYSSAWLDLTRGPVRVHVPDSGDRYFMLRSWTHGPMCSPTPANRQPAPPNKTSSSWGRDTAATCPPESR
ncbi:hypothetical protein GCM10011610_34540 [Nocardia rhizosphaerihabitans]|uniref:DUF1254 domain-containing protein n=1 Tax=Nocardia rhizosphaerihabitans TaxID=1691570 RepID=A0ABQ2KI81_9NOCA|nr:hypothetical protein GCM10011610_34540 [Nocardia rhizosphaerihabitans]